MVGFPANGPKSACRPGRVSTPLLLKTTSWQSGETPCGKSAGDISVISPPKISMGASSDPAVVILCLVSFRQCEDRARHAVPLRLPYGDKCDNSARGSSTRFPGGDSSPSFLFA